MARGIAPGDQPDKPQKPGQVPEGQVRYGEKGLKTGVRKEDQARNQPGAGGTPDAPAGGGWTPGAGDVILPQAGGTSYFNDKQQARIQELLGENYNPNKPLNVQLFQARWQDATPEQKRAMIKNLSADFLEGGPTSKTLAGFHGEYLDVLKELNSVHQQDLNQRLMDYESYGGGWAQTQTEYDANLAHWTEFAATPEGQAHIAGTGMSTEEWLQRETDDMQTGLKNYQQQQRQFSVIQRLSAQLGLDVPGFKPPGWDSTLAAIKAGQAHVPSAAVFAKYPGIAADLAGVTDTFTYAANDHGGRGDAGTGADAGATASTGTEGVSLMPYQPAYSSDEIAAQYI